MNESRLLIVAPYAIGGAGRGFGMCDQVEGSLIGLPQRTTGACRGHGIRLSARHAALPCGGLAGFLGGSGSTFT